MVWDELFVYKHWLFPNFYQYTFWASGFNVFGDIFPISKAELFYSIQEPNFLFGWPATASLENPNGPRILKKRKQSSELCR